MLAWRETCWHGLRHAGMGSPCGVRATGLPCSAQRRMESKAGENQGVEAGYGRFVLDSSESGIL